MVLAKSFRYHKKKDLNSIVNKMVCNYGAFSKYKIEMQAANLNYLKYALHKIWVEPFSNHIVRQSVCPSVSINTLLGTFFSSLPFAILNVCTWLDRKKTLFVMYTCYKVISLYMYRYFHLMQLPNLFYTFPFLSYKCNWP